MRNMTLTQAWALELIYSAANWLHRTMYYWRYWMMQAKFKGGYISNDGRFGLELYHANRDSF